MTWKKSWHNKNKDRQSSRSNGLGVDRVARIKREAGRMEFREKNEFPGRTGTSKNPAEKGERKEEGNKVRYGPKESDPLDS